MSQKHQGRRLSSLAAFRSRLLQFTLLITHRYHLSQTFTDANSLGKLRDQNATRAKKWLDAYGSKEEHPQLGPLPIDDLAAARKSRAAAVNCPGDFEFEFLIQNDRPSLQDLLPLFIELTAARINLGDDWQPTTDWFKLAGEFMLQAVLDQLLITVQCPTTTLESIFAWGYPVGEALHGEGPDVAAMRSLFCGSDTAHEELPEWTAIRRRYLHEVSQSMSHICLISTDWTQAASLSVTNFEEQHSYLQFEERLISFLKHLYDGVIKPDLVQVEIGRINIDGVELSGEKSRAAIARMEL